MDDGVESLALVAIHDRNGQSATNELISEEISVWLLVSEVCRIGTDHSTMIMNVVITNHK